MSTELATTQSSAVTMIRWREMVDVVSYDPSTGYFTWAKSRAGRAHKDGYWRINIMGREYLAHRLAWFISSREWPNQQIDHINGIRNDNRLENLRLATKEQNAQNSGLYKSNKSGFRGVSLKKGKWTAQIQANNKKQHIGYFPTKEAAASAYMEKAKICFGSFLRKSK